MDVNLSLGVNSGSGRRGDGSVSLVRRRSSQRFVEPEFEPKFEWVDTLEALVLVADLPGFKKDDVKVQLDLWGNLIISGEHRIEELVYAGGMWHPRQRTGFRFKKIFSIPENADATNISARFENEMFYITINKVRPPHEIKSTNILDQDNKSTPQTSESGASFIEESKDDKTSSNKSNQFSTDEKVKIPEVSKSSATKGVKSSSDKVDQSPRDEKVKNVESINFKTTQDEKASRNDNHDHSLRDERVETKGGAISNTIQDKKSLDDKMDQSPSDEKVQTQGVTKFGTNQYDEIDQTGREEKIETPKFTNSNIAQEDKVSSPIPNQRSRDEKAEISKVTEPSAIHIDDERLETPKVIKSNTIQDEIQMKTQSEALNQLEDLAKHTSLNKENLVDSNNFAKQSESLNFDSKEVEMKAGDQHGHKLVEKSNPPLQDHIQEIKVEEKKQSILKDFPFVSQFISSRRELIFIASVISFSFVLYIICALTHTED